MSTSKKNRINKNTHWHYVCQTGELLEKKCVLFTHLTKRIAVFETASGPRACDNRCPHQGYPLSEGGLTGKCILTCQWHNWKFDLDTGANLNGGDALQTYPLIEDNGRLWIDLTPPGAALLIDKIKTNLQEAFCRYDYERLSREIARLMQTGEEPLQALRWAIQWSWDKLEWGWTHAYAGIADWLELYAESSQKEDKLICLQEAIGHIAEDVLRQSIYSFHDQREKYSETALVLAIENQDESRAIALLNDALDQGFTLKELEKPLTQAALAHYNDFGHSLIYVTKIKKTVHSLGHDILKPLILSLVRSMVFAIREDYLPEFADYHKSLQAWSEEGTENPCYKKWLKVGVSKSLALTVISSGLAPEIIYAQLLRCAALNMLYFNVEKQNKAHVSVSNGTSWLNFSHALTFANAVRQQCTLFPEFWPQGLLQLACFTGRNRRYVDFKTDQAHWYSGKIEPDLENLIYSMLDHGCGEYIVSVHYLKTLLAVREEITFASLKAGQDLYAAVNRFLHSDLKRRHSRRVAFQTMQLVS